MRAIFPALLLMAAFTASTVAAQTPSRPINVNQTDAYGDERLLAFTYFMNFQCVHQPFDDLDNNGRAAAMDSNEFQSPRCVVGRSPRIDRPGSQSRTPSHCSSSCDSSTPMVTVRQRVPSSGRRSGSLFGFVPDAFESDARCAGPVS